MLNRILCLHEKYQNYNPKDFFSPCNFIIHHTVKAANLAKDVRVFYYDSQTKTGLHGMVKQLLREVKKHPPDALIYFVPFEIIHPLGAALQYIRRQYGTRLIAFFSDQVAGLSVPDVHRYYQYYTGLADALISADSTCTRAIYDHALNIQGHPTVDLNTFKPIPGTVKDIDVSFVGSVSANLYDSRREYLDYIKPELARAGYRLYTGGGQYKIFGEKRIPQAEYVTVINRSKIVLNFSRTYGNYRQLKGRVMEVMACKALVLTEACPDIGKFFTEGQDYISFNDKEELLEKLLYYLQHHDQRDQIACSAYQKMTEIYTPRHVWGYVLKKLGFDLTEIINENFQHYEQIMDQVQNTRDITYPCLHNADYIIKAMEQAQYNSAADLAIRRLLCLPYDAETWWYLGRSLYYAGHWTLADQALERCRLLDPLSRRSLNLSLAAPWAGGKKPLALDLLSELLTPPVATRVTAVIITKDNQPTIASCLNSLQGAVDNIVVVDTGSKDGTLEILQQQGELYHNIRLIPKKGSYFKAALKTAIQQAGADGAGWIFLVHPDEYLLPEDRANIKLAASLFTGRKALINVLTRPVTDHDYSVEFNRLFPQTDELVLTHYGAGYGADTESLNQTVNIRLHYDLIN